MPVIALSRTMSGAVVAAARMFEEKAEGDIADMEAGGELGGVRRCGHG